MENSNITKQAKSDIFKELYTIINFYITKGATAKALKKYYKNSKRIDDIIEDIKSKGSNLITDENEYKNLVKNILNDMLDDIIAKEKDDEYKNKQKMKHLKEFYNFENTNESIMGTIYLFAIGFFLYKFIKSILKNSLEKKLSKVTDEVNHLQIQNILLYLKNINKVPIIDLNDRYFIRLNDESGSSIDIRIMKEDKLFKIDTNKGDVNIQLSDNEYNQFLELIKKEK